MKRKTITLLAAVLAMTAFISGCGKNQQQQETQEPEVQQEQQESQEKQDIYVFIAASLSNSMEEIKAAYEAEHENVNIIYNADSSGTLQTQIQEGAQCDIFFSAATKQMDALVEGGYVVEGSVTNLLENKIVLIQPAGGETTVTGFENITEAASLALAGEDVPVGQYARTLFENLGILDQVMEMEINEGANVTAVLAAVAEGSNEVGVVYATDAASMPERVEIIAEATTEQVDAAIYPVGLIENPEASQQQKTAAEEFKEYLAGEKALEVLTRAGFKPYTE